MISVQTMDFYLCSAQVGPGWISASWPCLVAAGWAQHSSTIQTGWPPSNNNNNNKKKIVVMMSNGNILVLLLLCITELVAPNFGFWNDRTWGYTCLQASWKTLVNKYFGHGVKNHQPVLNWGVSTPRWLKDIGNCTSQHGRIFNHTVWGLSPVCQVFLNAYCMHIYARVFCKYLTSSR